MAKQTDLILMHKGVAITAEMVTGKNRRGEATHYARYSLAEVGQ